MNQLYWTPSRKRHLAADEVKKKYAALMDHYSIDEDKHEADFNLAKALAMVHVPGFSIISKEDDWKGRPPKVDPFVIYYLLVFFEEQSRSNTRLPSIRSMCKQFSSWLASVKDQPKYQNIQNHEIDEEALRTAWKEIKSIVEKITEKPLIAGQLDLLHLHNRIQKDKKLCKQLNEEWKLTRVQYDFLKHILPLFKS